MARRAGSLATERTDYSNRRLFPGNVVHVPLPFARLEDFVFTAHNTLLPPTSKMVALIDPSRVPAGDATGPRTLDDTSSALLEAELIHCVRAKSVSEADPAAPKLRMAILWGRFSEMAATVEQRGRAESYERQYLDSAIVDLFMEFDPQFATFGYRYGWSATLILERYAETAELRSVATIAWQRAAAEHVRLVAANADRKVRRIHEQMAAIDTARAHAVGVARGRNLMGHGETNVVALRGRAGQTDRR